MSKYAFIWDLDGTLVDSYTRIVPAIRRYCEEYGLHYDDKYIRDYVIRYSAGSFFDQIAPLAGKDPEDLKKEYDSRNDIAIDGICPMIHARDILEKLTKAGHLCFIFTHRGISCFEILEETGLMPYFSEIVTSRDGFPRKPEPDGILYLLKKHRLDPEKTYYVGDRTIDIQSGNNAGIGTILYLPEGSPVRPGGTESLVIRDLLEIEKVID